MTNVTALTIALLGASAALADHVALAHTTLSFDRPPKPYECLEVPCGRAPPAPPGTTIRYSGKVPGEDSQAPYLSMGLYELDGDRWASAEAYVAAATVGGEKIVPTRAVTFGGIPALEVARIGPGATTNWSREWTEITHLFVFQSQNKLYICHLAANAEVYEFVRPTFISFCNSIRDSARRPQ